MQTVCAFEGLNFTTNAGSAIRQCSLLGATELYFCPISEVIYHKIQQITLSIDHGRHQLKSHALHSKTKKWTYTHEFRKNSKYFSMGYDVIPIHYDTPIRSVIEHHLENDFHVYRLENTKKEEDSIFKKNFFHGKILFVAGNETLGLSEEIMNMKHEHLENLYIPSALLPIHIDSFNVSNSMILACYERFRQTQ